MTEKQMADGHALRLERVFAVPPDRVFDAWTDPAIFRQWAWGSLGMNTIATIDLRVGGQYSVETDKPEADTDDSRDRLAFHGIYETIETNKRIVMSLNWDANMGEGYGNKPERITVLFKPMHDDSGCTNMVFHHDRIPIAQAVKPHEQGWSDCFRMLKTLLEPSK